MRKSSMNNNNKNNDNIIKHLEMIQNVIQRTSNNSFQLKGWSITLVGLIGALGLQGSDKRFFLLVFIPLFAFWFLDSFYLQIERKYKILYKNVLTKENDMIDFCMDTASIKPEGDDIKKICFLDCLFSTIEAGFYLPIIIAVIALAILLFLY